MLSVHQFVSQLDLESQGALLASKEAFLAYLREQYAGQSPQCQQVRRDLELAARAQVKGQRVLVEALPVERNAAQAVLYAVMKLADRLRESQPEVVSSYRVYHDARQQFPNAETRKRWRAGYSGAGGWATRDDLYPRFPFVVTFTANGRETARLSVRADRLEATLEDVGKRRGFSRRYVAAIAAQVIQGERLEWRATHPQAQLLARKMLLEARTLAQRCPRLTAPPVLDVVQTLEPARAVPLPGVEVIPEILEIGETAHFEASSRETGYARVVIDGEEVARVRCWCADEAEPFVDPQRDRIRGGTIRVVGKPRGTPVLLPNQARVIELCNGSVGQRSERLYGRGTRDGELWLRGTADREVMAVQMRTVLARQAKNAGRVVN